MIIAVMLIISAPKIPLHQIHAPSDTQALYLISVSELSIQ
jgi:hypothetical protein